MVAWNTNDGGIAVVAGARTPFAKAGGPLRHEHVTDLAKRAMQETLYRANVPFERTDEVLLGNVVMPVDATNPARVSSIWAGIPNTIPAMTVQRNCASGMEAIAEGVARIRTGRGRLILAGGAESMSRLPLLFPEETAEPLSRMARARHVWQKAAAVTTLRPRHFKPVVALEQGLTDPTCGMIMGLTAEKLAGDFGISREEQDAFALQSHQRATAAAGKLNEEIAPEYAGSRFEPVIADTGPRPGQTLEALARLKPIFDRRDGSVTVGNSCQVTDGSAMVLLADPEVARSEGLDVMGYVRGYAYVGLDPSRMGLGPVFAIDQLLRQSGMVLSDIPIFEINEAFAAQVLACLNALASDAFAREQLGRDKAVGEMDPDRLNVNGGAIALGHPVGATGARLVLTLLKEMRRRDVEFGVAALCVGGGQGAAILLQRR